MNAKPPKQGLMLSQLMISEPYLAAIGMVALESTYLEKYVERLIWRLCRIDPEQGKFVTDRMQMDSRLELLSDLAKPKMLENPSKLDVFTKIISNLKAANRERNVVIHGLWIALPKLPIPESGIIEWETPTARKERLKSPALTMSANQISRVAETINRGLHELVSFGENEWPESEP